MSLRGPYWPAAVSDTKDDVLSKGGQALVGQAQIAGGPGREVMHHYVGGGHQRPHDFPGARVGEVDGDAELAAIEVVEEGRKVGLFAEVPSGGAG